MSTARNVFKSHVSDKNYLLVLKAVLFDEVDDVVVVVLCANDAPAILS